MDNWSDRDDWFIDEEDNYDDFWLKPNTEAWRSIHPLGHNPYEYDRPWGAWDSNNEDN